MSLTGCLLRQRSIESCLDKTTRTSDNKKIARIGPASAQRVALLDEKENIQKIIEFVSTFRSKPIASTHFGAIGKLPLKQGVKLADLLSARIDLETIAEEVTPLKDMLESIADRKEEIVESTNIKIKYSGYIKRERLMADKLRDWKTSALKIDLTIKRSNRYRQKHEKS